MAGNYVTPMMLVTGTSFANDWYNKHTPNLRILLGGAVATGILALFSNIPGMGDVSAGIAWVAFVALMISPIQNPSPADNILKIVGSNG